MSDEFDKEEEKEKLRRQLAEEEEARESTRHMSELLLKGATMTNRHCDACGDPLFRHQGREFCPTCGGETAADQAAGGGAADQTTGDGGTAVEAPERAAGPPADDVGTTEPSSAVADQATAGPAEGAAPAGGGEPVGEADLPAAREALARKVTALVREAEATADAGRARELLAAVREGAEALRALEGVDR